MRAVKGAEVGVDPEEEPPTPTFDIGRPLADRPMLYRGGRRRNPVAPSKQEGRE